MITIKTIAPYGDNEDTDYEVFLSEELNIKVGDDDGSTNK